MGALAQARYDAVVVGTGFGGAVAACRLAQAGLRVGVLERGRRFPPGSFPERHEALAWQFGGPYDIKPLQSIAVVQAAGYGGGSLIYANVQMRAAPDLFGEGWPASYSRAALDPDYDLVAHMLGIAPVGPDPATGAPPTKTTLMEGAAARLGRSEQAFRPNLAVNFADVGAPPAPNRFGRLQAGCIHCGRCDVGCNVGAKNTLDLNYLAAAETAGADIATQAELEWLGPEGEGYRLRFRDHETGTLAEVAAREVYLCMGAVNTTEFLLRCRDRFRTLPALSARLGCAYSANGDFFAFGLAPREGFAATRGPTITVALAYDGGDPASPVRFTLEEGGFRKELAVLLPLLEPRRMLDLLRRGRNGLAKRMRAQGDGTVLFLVMGRDRADGRLELSRLTGRLKVRWNRAANAGLYEAEAAACEELIRELGGTMAMAPNWRLFGQPSTVHNLGGCAMGNSSGSGVVDGEGEAFGYPGLRVLDGSIIPRAIGVNPSHTIAAVAERCIRHAIRRRPGLENWSAPEAADAPRLVVPEDRALAQPPPSPSPAVPQRRVALLWRERMRGEAEGTEGTQRAVDLQLTVAAASAADFVGRADHRANVSGTVSISGLADRAAVENGFCNLFIDEAVEGERAMIYVLPFRTGEGALATLRGRKRVRGRWPWDFWRTTTNMQVVVEGEGLGALRGHVALGIGDVSRMALSLRAGQGGSMRRNLAGLFSFLGFFAVSCFRLARAGWGAAR